MIGTTSSRPKVGHERKTYRVEAERDGRWWVASMAEIKGAHTQARRLDQLELMARDVISLILDVPEDSFDIDIHASLPEDVEDLAARTREARSRADASADEANEFTREAVPRLLAKGLPVRDVAVILGLSFQRVSQLARSLQPNHA